MNDTTTSRLVSRWSTPVSLALALLVFLLPFVSVSCDAPGGFGRSAQGGTTSYTGVDLATGSAPSIDADHLRPADEQQSDSIGVQPAVAASALLLIAGIIAWFVSAMRRSLVAALAAAAGLCLLVGAIVARSTIADRVTSQSTEPFPPDKSASEYVGLQFGVALSILLILVAVVTGLLSARREQRSGPSG